MYEFIAISEKMGKSSTRVVGDAMFDVNMQAKMAEGVKGTAHHHHHDYSPCPSPDPTFIYT